MRLDRLLANSGIGTRSSVRQIIASGGVTVNGVTAKDPGMQVRETDTVALNGSEIGRKDNLYFLLDKPDGVLTAMEDPRLPCVGDYIPDELRGKKLAPVGRLDYHTTGLLIITNDGELSHRLQSPKYHVAKRYLVNFSGQCWSEKEISSVASGVTLTDMDTPVKTAPAELSPVDDSTAEITLYEGKTHEVRRIFAHFGKEVIALRRVSLAGLEIADSAQNTGTIRELTDEEIKLLKEAVSL
ncbi:MAG: rRNA pseudouridine synthase [Ruminococcaceae bacterium]|nr:rRNA pseudouridine synthase [Oscillospiraceae bacterium]